MEHDTYVTYKSRWWVLGTVALLTVSNNALWISFAAVTTATAEYFDVTTSKATWLTTISFLVGMPACLVSTYLIDRGGLKLSVWITSMLTVACGLIRFIVTLPGIRDSMSEDLQFIFCMVAQTLIGIGNPICVSMPTKVSQNWFAESEIQLATGILAMGLPIGITCGYGITAAFVQNGDDIPTMNVVWFIPAVITMGITIFAVRTSMPPTPPSRSAAESLESHQEPYWANMKKFMKNKQFLLVVFILGGAVGFFNCFITLLQPMMCARGYETWFSGLCGSLMLGTGFIGAIVTGVFVAKTGLMEETTKVFLTFAVLAAIAICELLRLPEIEAWLAISFSMFGIFGFGVYPLGLELSVEATYPLDEGAGTALIFFSGQVQGAILIFVSAFLAKIPSHDDMLIEKCSVDGSEIEPIDFSSFLLFLAGYITLLGCTMIIFFHTKYNRKIANMERERDYQTKESDDEVEVQRL